MMRILVTGSSGFIGRNLAAWLQPRSAVRLFCFDIENRPDELDAFLASADRIFHLAGVNRPHSDSEFQRCNVDLTARICRRLLELGRPVPLIFSSSVQAEMANPYGISKRQAEDVIRGYAVESGARAVIYRLKNVFGKWCRPGYNSVVATFCHNVARGLALTVSDPDKEMDLVHVDDVVRHFLSEIETVAAGGVECRDVTPSYKITPGRLAELIRSFQESRSTLRLSDFSDELTRKLYGTYLSYLDGRGFSYALDRKCDARGCLAEFLKSAPFGQLFVSRTAPGATRGNHYHHTKAEKFLVVEGKAVIRFRHALGGEILEIPVRGEDFRVVDIPPGYAHSIENVGTGDLVTLFWSHEVYDPEHPDTQYTDVGGREQ